MDPNTLMQPDSKVHFYQEIIKKAHDSFREFLVHLPEDILEWQIHESLNSVRWIIEHVIHDQLWIANVIMNNYEEGYHFEESIDQYTLDELVEKYDDVFIAIEEKLADLKEEHLNEARMYKEFSLPVEDWLYEYIHHLNHHSGEIGLILTAWKRKKRSLQ